MMLNMLHRLLIFKQLNNIFSACNGVAPAIFFKLVDAILVRG